MMRKLDRRRFLQAGSGLGAALLLPQALACEFDTSTLRVVKPWTRATAPGATTAILCMEFEEVTMDDRLIGLSTPIAKGARMVGGERGEAIDFRIPRGLKSELSESGIHVVLTGLKIPLLMGREYPLMLVFERAGVVAADVDVAYDHYG